mgnify:CR=1 FL=1
MQEIQIWHNPKCSKSRGALELLETKGIKTDIVKYLETTPSREQLINILKKLNMKASELLRTGEDIYKELNLNQIEDENELIDIMVENPILIERPIIVKGEIAVIARPIENLEELLK